MDISCIISSGDLELYVLGMLSEEDNVKVARLADLFPEIKKEIDDIEQSLLQVNDDANDMDVPSSQVKDNLFAQLKALKTTSNTDPIADNRNDIVDEKREAKTIPMRKPKRMINTLMLAASVLALIFCAAVISHLSSANKHYHEVADNMASKVNVLQQNTLTLQQNLNLYQDTNYQKINLTHVPRQARGIGAIVLEQNHASCVCG